MDPSGRVDENLQAARWAEEESAEFARRVVQKRRNSEFRRAAREAWEQTMDMLERRGSYVGKPC